MRILPIIIAPGSSFEHVGPAEPGSTFAGHALNENPGAKPPGEEAVPDDRRHQGTGRDNQNLVPPPNRKSCFLS